jgi:diguanylate cyclase (GGDEF)-like protein/PAS domain S-box-containing protein
MVIPNTITSQEQQRMDTYCDPNGVSTDAELQVGHSRRLSLAEGLAIESPMAVLDKYGIINFSSPSMGKLFDCDQNEIDGREVSSIIPGLPLKTITPGYNLAFADFWGKNGELLQFNGEFAKSNQTSLAVSLKKICIDNTPLILLRLFPGNQSDRLNDELNQFIKSTEKTADAVMITDTKGIICSVNSAFEKGTGYTRDEALGRPASLIKSGLHDNDFYRNMWQALHDGHDFQAVFVNRKKNGEIFHEEKHIRPFINGAGIITHFVATSRSLSETLRTTLLRLHHEAYHDALTGLPNRLLFEDRLKQAFSRASRRGDSFSLVYVDLDSFKEINDTHGHTIGDSILRTTATLLKACVRDEDTVARLGGDEFALIIQDVHSRRDIETVLDKIIKSLNQGTRLGKTRIPILASIGANIYPDDGNDRDTLMTRADFAMYRAKSMGGHCFHFFDIDELDQTTSAERVNCMPSAKKPPKISSRKKRLPKIT